MAEYDNNAFNTMKKLTTSKADSIFANNRQGNEKSYKSMPLSPSGKQQWSADEVTSFKKNIYEMASTPESSLWLEPKRFKNMLSVMNKGYLNELGKPTSIWNVDDGQSMGWSVENPDSSGTRLDVNVPKGFAKTLDKKMRYDEDREYSSHLKSWRSDWFGRGGGKDLPEVNRKDRHQETWNIE